jgi:hypothetical protein
MFTNRLQTIRALAQTRETPLVVAARDFQSGAASFQTRGNPPAYK